jgi:hypothetical protein
VQTADLMAGWRVDRKVGRKVEWMAEQMVER